MAIEYTLLLKDGKLTKEMLMRKIESMGYTCNHMEQLPKGIAIILYEQVGFEVFLLEYNQNDYYRVWDIGFLEREFTYEKSLSFRWDKFYPDVDQQYKVMLKLIFELMDELNEEALLLGSGSGEYCFFRENAPLLLNSEYESSIWKWRHFKDMIADREVAYV